jgi:nitroimidazol reductase NimA-like FMN-containing flavoprotein (pyridoxamine 5'-phosphate oxidase superfamily)
MPAFRELDRAEIVALLARNHVGRIAYTFHDRVGLEPIGYVFSDDGIYCRTSPGTKLETLRHHPWVAFEVDEVEGPYDWRSVVARGTVHLLSVDGTTFERQRYARALELLHRLEPETFEDADPAPFRNTVLRIHIDELTGREARSGRSR